MPPRGFTLVELLVVIAILVLLAGLIAGGASRLFQQQKIRATQQTMSNMLLAIDNYSKENPLRMRYDTRDGGTFGPFPPYMLANRSFPIPRDPRTLADLFDGDIQSASDYTLDYRIARDIGDRNPPSLGDPNWLRFSPSAGRVVDDDNRALAVYLSVFSRSSLSLVPERNRAPLAPDEYVNPRGTPNPADRIDLLGFVDAWGVPLDYFLYVKIGWSTHRNSFGIVQPAYRIVDRVPVIRSRGVDREKYDQWVNSNADPAQRLSTLLDPARQILSSEIPKPYAVTTDMGATPQDGVLTNGNDNQNLRSGGWLRLVAGSAGTIEYQDDAKYRPE